VAGSCEHGNELSGSIKGGEFLNQLLKKDSAPCSQFVRVEVNSRLFTPSE
jgi:hypothetical protein